MSGARAICHTALQIRLIKETSFREEIVRRSRLYGGGCWRPRQPSWLDLRYENGRLGRRLARRLPGGLSLQVSFHSVDHSCQPIQGRNENLEQVGSILSPNQNQNRNFLKKWSKFRHINSYSSFFSIGNVGYFTGVRSNRRYVTPHHLSTVDQRHLKAKRKISIFPHFSRSCSWGSYI